MCLATVPGAEPETDRIAEEIARWTSIVSDDAGTDQAWVDAKQSSGPALTRARDELRNGRRLVALDRLGAVAQTLGAAQYVMGRPVQERTELLAFEAEWKRMGRVLHLEVALGGAGSPIESIRPALARALAELFISQARESYYASLEYGRNTEPQYGLYYLGAAQARRDFVEFLRGLPAPPPAPALELRTLRPEIDSLQSQLLAAYRPPASIERHGEFIVASSALKEAREQDAAGHRFAALLRYLQAAQQIAMLTRSGTGDRAATERRLAESAARLGVGGDHSIGQLFVERASSALAAEDGGPAAEAIAGDVLPRYFAALEPPRAASPIPSASVTVTLVRWPFT